MNTNFSNLATYINGANITTANISPTAGIVGTQLSSSANILGSQLSASAGILQAQLGFTIPTTMVSQGRMYGTSGSPFADTTNATSVYFGPVYGNQIVLYNGTTEVLQTFSEVSVLLSGLTASTMYDLYVTSASSTTVTLSTTAWSGVTTPPTRGTQDGRLTQNGTPAALYVGSFYNGSAQVTEDRTAERFIWNYYNRYPKYLYAADTTASWAVSSTTMTSANANTTDGVGRFAIAVGLAIEPVQVSYQAAAQNATAGDYITIGIGLDSTSSASFTGTFRTNSITSAPVDQTTCNGIFAGNVGLHYFQRLEGVSAAAGTIFYNPSGVTGASASTFMQGLIYV